MATPASASPGQDAPTDTSYETICGAPDTSYETVGGAPFWGPTYGLVGRICRHPEISLVEFRNEEAKEDEKAILLEGGSLPSASPRARNESASPILRFLLMDETFLLENRLTLRAMSEFGLLLAYFYLCDRTNLFGESTKSYNRDLFLFLYFLLIVVAAMTSFTIHKDKSPFSGRSILYLNRHQTEEWKGWMQVLFLMYHYFAASEMYNAIRVFIAAYVWMTGFGNFSYYYVRKDFSFARFAQIERWMEKLEETEVKKRIAVKAAVVTNSLLVSYRLFELTNTLKMAFVPSKDDKRLTYNILVAVATSLVLYSLSFMLLKVSQLQISLIVNVSFKWKS
ncbi:hypothetical protein Cgig2_026052 [Carnegiea gigantea]|uniref:Cas1p 10 TM acyl transferase domain-containing protein n=1 Tax=Carnegiea gigantea TaxID=171969 RepID=A0A9Q1QMP1_9CARY|nr:hypothetical protein Cgig2_026052 [Carnegiea gigantea]